MSAVPPAWATSSYGESAETTPVQLAELGEHVSHCAPRGGRLSLLLCGADALHGFVLGRLMTTLTVVGCMVAAAWLFAS